MSATKIEWADKVWNPVTGCTALSPGCAKCYARRMAQRLAGRYGYPRKAPFRLTVHENKYDEPRHWQKPQRIFLGSMTDLFQGGLPVNVWPNLLSTIRACPRHTFMVLTKRPENIGAALERDVTSPVGNLWLGVSVESAEYFYRVLRLLKLLAVVRFISFEPLLGRIGRRVLDLAQGGGVGWCIVGGETGPGARPFDLDWARELRDWSLERGIPFFYKGCGSHYARAHGIPKSLRGMLDGWEHRDFPGPGFKKAVGP